MLCRGVWTGLFLEDLNIMKKDKGSRLSWDLTFKLLTCLRLEQFDNCCDPQLILSLFWSNRSARSCTVDITFISLCFDRGDSDTSLEKLGCSPDGQMVLESFLLGHLSGVLCLKDVEFDTCCTVCAVLQLFFLVCSILNNFTVFSSSLYVSGCLLGAGTAANINDK